MMDLYLALKALHVVGATVILGTGAGIAFFMVMAHRSRDPRIVAHTAGVVVIADTVFTASAVILQPLTGYALAQTTGSLIDEGWLLVSLLLYVATGLFWLPVVWMQLRMRNLARDAAAQGTTLPPEYDRLYRLWFAFGFPAFACVLAIVWLMVAKPEL